MECSTTNPLSGSIAEDSYLLLSQQDSAAQEQGETVSRIFNPKVTKQQSATKGKKRKSRVDKSGEALSHKPSAVAVQRLRSQDSPKHFPRLLEEEEEGLAFQTDTDRGNTGTKRTTKKRGKAREHLLHTEEVCGKGLTPERKFVFMSVPTLPGLPPNHGKEEKESPSPRSDETPLEVEFNETIQVKSDLRKPAQPGSIIRPPGSKKHHRELPKRGPEDTTRRLERTQSMIMRGERRGWDSRSKSSFSMIETSPMSVDAFLELEKKKTILKFNQTLETRLEKAWERGEKPPVSTHALNVFVQDFCFDMICELFRKEKLGLLRTGDFEIRREEITEQLLEHISNNGVPLIPIIQRCNIILKELKGCFEDESERTAESEYLYQAVEQMMFRETDSKTEEALDTDVGMGLGTFLQRYRKLITGRQDSKFVEFLRVPLGEKKKDRKEVLRALECWANPPPELRSQFFHDVEAVFRTIIKARNIILVDHLWQEDPCAKKLVSNIFHYDIFRSLMFGDSVLFQRISINGKAIYDEKDASTKPESKKNFYRRLFSELHKAVFPDKKKSRKSIEEVVQYTLKMLEEGKERCPQKESPLVKVLIPCSINAWVHAFKYLQFLYPSLFNAPFRTREWKEEGEKILTCDIDVSGVGDYKVTVDRRHAVFETDEHGAIVDRDKPLALFTVRWVMTVDNDKLWEGCLTIPRRVKFTEHATIQQRRSILTSIANATDPRSCPVKNDNLFGRPRYQKQYRHTKNSPKKRS
ncbi:MAG: hypothetical protein ACE5GN_02540 [Waddliaceae bacterium]